MGTVILRHTGRGGRHVRLLLLSLREQRVRQGWKCGGTSLVLLSVFLG